jgi:predicted  nucleic acid-binding Zn-ribbon protein
MSRKASDTTLLRAARSELREQQRQINTMRIELAHYRGRASKAESEEADWRKRFDILLERTPKEQL